MFSFVLVREVGLPGCLQSCEKGRTISFASGQGTGIERLHDEVVEFFRIFFGGRPSQLVIAMDKVGLFLSAIRVVCSLGSLIFEVHVTEIAEIDVHFADVSIQFTPIQLTTSLSLSLFTSTACSTSPNSMNILVTSPRSNISSRTMFPKTLNLSQMTSLVSSKAMVSQTQMRITLEGSWFRFFCLLGEGDSNIIDYIIRSTNQLKNNFLPRDKSVQGMSSEFDYQTLIRYCKIRMEERQSFREKNLFTDAGLEVCGFEVAARQQISKSLYRVIPDGKQSVMYDAIQEAFNNFINLNLMIQESGTADKWQLSLVVVFSGPDRGSRVNWNTVLNSYEQVKKRLSHFKVVFVAYDVKRQIYEQLFFLEGLDQYEPVSVHLATSRQELDIDENIGRLMQRIREELGLRTRKEGLEGSIEDVKRNPYDSDKNYGVMVLLSGDETYRGQSWTKLCHGVQTLIKPLGDQDLFGSMVYSDQIQQFWGDKFQSKQGSFTANALPPREPQENYRPEEPYFYPQQPQYRAPLLPPPHPVPVYRNNNNQCCKRVLGFVVVFIFFFIVGYVSVS